MLHHQRIHCAAIYGQSLSKDTIQSPNHEHLFCHGVPLQCQGCGVLILIAAKSSLYSTKPYEHY
ncbi:hypothetical protein EGO53_28930 (plasmid) [Serratia liquefaciens]|uniref:Uncharacterized protein n=1 Tax=Serratia liquefaciens TaxID=614 RepID=A0A515D5Y0_SERLI|nr:hypothetical protein EGO53_28930 [Serratia liquefaciens]